MKKKKKDFQKLSIKTGKMVKTDLHRINGGHQYCPPYNTLRHSNHPTFNYLGQLWHHDV